MPGSDITPCLVWLAEVPFAGSPHRQQHLARLLARRYRVLFIEPARPMRLPSLHIMRYDTVRVAQVAPLLNAYPFRQIMRSRSARRVAQLLVRLQVRRALRAARMNGSGASMSVVCSNVYLIDAARALRPQRLVTDICDDPRHYPGEPTWTDVYLRQAVLEADVVTTSSRSLQADFRGWGAPSVEYLPNGIHEQFLHAAPSTRPAAHPPVLGFVGHLGVWVDLELLGAVARACPDMMLEIVGSVAPACRDALDRLRRESNVHYVAEVPYTGIPTVLARFSVGLIPFRLSSYTRAVNPVKLYEYAALDLPVVATAFSPDLCQWRDIVDVCAGPDQFIHLARERAMGRRRASTRPIAESHTWERIGAALEAVLQPGAQDQRAHGMLPGRWDPTRAESETDLRCRKVD